MQFRDPAGTVNLRLPAGWALDLASSTLTHLVFDDWAHPESHQLFVTVQPTPADATLQAWQKSVAQRLPPDIDTMQLTVEPSPVVWVVRPGREGRRDQRWAVVRGNALDVWLEDVGVQRGGPIRTPVLQQAVQSLFVPANSATDDPPVGTWDELMDEAEGLLARGDKRGGAAGLQHASNWAMVSSWVSLRRRTLEPLLMVASAQSLLSLSSATGSLGAFDDGTTVLMRALAMLEDGPDKASAAGLLQGAYAHLGKAAGTSAPKNMVAAALELSRLAVRAAAKSTTHQSAADAEYATRVAVETAARCVVLAGRLAPDVQQLVRTEALSLLVAAGAATSAVQSAFGISPSLEPALEWLLAARALHELSPSIASAEGVVLALSQVAGAQLQIGDEPSLDEADQLLHEAQGLLTTMGEHRATAEIDNQIWLNSAWVSLELRRYGQALDEAEQIKPAANAAIQRSQASVQSAALLALGRNGEALDRARECVGDDDPSESAHRLALGLALWANDLANEALEQVRLGLLAALTEYPFGDPVQRLLFAMAEMLEQPNPALALKAIVLGRELMDYDVRWLSRSPEVAGYDEVARHRALVASLVLRLLDSGATLDALAEADHARARTLVPGWARTSPGDREVPLFAVPAGDTDLAGLIELLGSLLASANAKAGVLPQPSGEQLVELVKAAGRSTLVLHPTPDHLVRFLVRPNGSVEVSRVEAQVSMVTSATEDLRRLLSITVVLRGGRGGAAVPADADVQAALAAWGAEDADAPDGQDAALQAARRSVFDLLLGGLDLAPDEPLAIVPYRELAVIPISGLLSEDGHPVAALHPTSALPSIAASVWMPTTQPPQALPRPRAVVIGNPQLDPALGLADLGSAVGEASTVAALLRASCEVIPLVAGEATEAAVREHAFGARLLHLACHAAVREPADESALFLAAGPHDDGLLKVGDAADLMLDDALVVLAACETGLGRITPDGVHGLGQAFVRAGARCVLLSLWRVGDVSTAFLMERLYQGLVGADGQEPMDVSAALALAQLATMAVYPELGQWGPWLLLGDGSWRL